MIYVRYFSKLGNTKKVAEEIARICNVEAKSIVDSPKIDEHVDILFLGGAPYANVMDPKLKEYANNLDKNNVGLVVLFSTSNWSRRTIKGLKKILKEKGIKIYDNYFYAQMFTVNSKIKKVQEFVNPIINKN